MKSARRRVLLGVASIAAMVLLPGSNITARALSPGLKVEIPFAFHAGQGILPAGTYIVEKRGDVIRISDGKGHTAAALANAVTNKAAGLADQVVFNRYGENRFLSEVRWREYSAARRLITSSTERKLGEALSPERVMIAAITR